METPIVINPLRLRAARVSSRLSVGQVIKFGKIPELTRETLAAFESGAAIPSRAMPNRLAQLYHFSIADLQAEPLHFPRVREALTAFNQRKITESQFTRYLMLDAVQCNLQQDDKVEVIS